MIEEKTKEPQSQAPAAPVKGREKLRSFWAKVQITGLLRRHRFRRKTQRHMNDVAKKLRASAVVLAHNHPSGVALPSPADNATTLSVFDALRTVGVALADHIIVADDDFVSLRHNGLLPEREGNGYGI